MPGVHGEWPGLAAGDLVDGDLAVTTKARDVLAAVVSARLRPVSLGTLFPSFTPLPVGAVAAR